MWNSMDKVTRFALVIGAIPVPLMVAQLIWGLPGYFFPTLMIDLCIVGFFWALAQGLKAVFIPRP